MPSEEVGGNPSRCDSCPIPIDQCAAICEDCEEKKTGECKDGCPKDCGVLDQGPDEAPDDPAVVAGTGPDDQEGDPDYQGEDDDENC